MHYMVYRAPVTKWLCKILIAFNFCIFFVNMRNSFTAEFFLYFVVYAELYFSRLPLFIFTELTYFRVAFCRACIFSFLYTFSFLFTWILGMFWYSFLFFFFLFCIFFLFLQIFIYGFFFFLYRSFFICLQVFCLLYNFSLHFFPVCADFLSCRSRLLYFFTLYIFLLFFRYRTKVT